MIRKLMSQDRFHLLEPGTLVFQCNICGQRCQTKLDELTRETQSCSCGSNTRRRSVIRVLTTELFGKSLTLTEIDRHPELKGLGMTDWNDYAPRLAEKFSYQNTFYHKEPRLDISDRNIAPELIGSHDFIISSDVFEHIVPPVSQAFENVRRMLRPGGLFVLTVPYGIQEKTTEHFPELNEFHLIEENGSYRLRNITKTGEIQEFDRLVFHGGAGATLEMRAFAEVDLIRHLEKAEFERITIHRAPDFVHGIWWPQPWSLPISAWRPKC